MPPKHEPRSLSDADAQAIADRLSAQLMTQLGDERTVWLACGVATSTGSSAADCGAWRCTR